VLDDLNEQIGEIRMHN